MANGASCRLTPMVKNKNGEEVESKLYQELESLMSSIGKGGRTNVLPLYQRTLDPSFVNDMKTRGASFDENGEVTLYSLLNFTSLGSNFTESQITSWLNTTYQLQNKQGTANQFNLSDILKQISEFQKTEWSKKYIPNIVSNNENDCYGSIVSYGYGLTGEHSQTLKYLIKVYNQLGRTFRTLGVEQKILDRLIIPIVNIYTRYGQITDVVDSINDLIKAINGKKPHSPIDTNVAMILVSLMENSPLYTRLYNLAEQWDPELVMEHEEYRYISTTYPTEVTKYVVATVLAKYLNGEPYIDNLHTLCERFVKSAKKQLPSKYLDHFKILMLNADNGIGILNKILSKSNNKKLIYSLSNLKGVSINKVKTALQTTKDLWDAAYQLTAKRQKLYQKSKRELSVSEEALESKQEVLEDQSELLTKLNVAAYEDNWFTSNVTKEEYRITTAINLVDTAIKDTDRIKNAVQELKAMIENGTYRGSMNSACGKLRDILNYIESYEKLYSLFDELINSELNLPEYQSIPNIEDIKSQLKEQVKTLNEILLDVKREVVINEYKDTSKSLMLQVLLKGLSDFIPEGSGLVVGSGLNGELLTLEELLLYSDNDITMLSAWLNSMANTGDVIGRIYDHVVKTQKQQARQECLEIKRRIIAAGKKLEGVSIKARNHEFMYVHDKQGNIPVDNMGRPRYITEYDKTKANEEYKRFYESLKIKYHNLPDVEAAIKIREEIELWINTYFEKKNGEYYPKAEYFPNAEYEKLSDAEKEFHKTFMEEKRKLDKYLPIMTNDSTNAIIIRKSFWQKVLTAESFKQFRESVWDYLKDLVKRNATDNEFGTKPVLMNFSGKTIDQLPIYYTRVDKKSPLSNYSMNCVLNLCAYAETATNYKAMVKVINILELGRDALKYRKTIKRENGKALINPSSKKALSKFIYLDQAETHFTKRLNNFMDMQVYGKMKTGKFAKPAGLFARTVGLFTTAANIYVGITNVLQGLGQINIEMFAGEHFTIGDLLKAKVIYWKNILPLIFETGSLNKRSILSLLSEDFNMMQEKDYNKNAYERNRLYRIDWGSLPYLFNHIGEHYMQHIAFLAMMNREKITTKDGKKISVLDAYETEALDPNDKSLGSRLKLKSYSDSNGNTSQTYYDKNGKRIVTFNQLKVRQKEWEKKGKYYDLYSKALLEDDEIAEYDFKGYISRKGAKINQDMHGIYNEEDKNQLQQKAFGGLFMMYRKHIAPNFMKRWKFKGYDFDLDTTTEGYQRLLWEKLFSRDVDEFGKLRWKMLMWTPEERRNVLGRNFGQLFNWMSINILISLLDDEDDDDDNLWMAILITSLYRTKSENAQFEPLSMFSNYSLVQDWLRILNQPVVGISLIDSAFELTQLLNPNVWTEEITRGKYAGKTKAERIILKNVPGFNQMLNIKQPPIDYYRKTVGKDWATDYVFGGLND